MRKIFTFLVVLLTALSINAAEFREIKDISGDIVKVPANIEKIATLWYANNQIVLMLGGLIRQQRRLILLKIISGFRMCILEFQAYLMV